MNRNENTPTRSRTIQEALYAKAGSPDFSFSIPTPFTPGMFVDAAEETGADAAGMANQMNQVLAENLGNSMASRAKKADKDNVDLPSQEDMDTLYLAYNFTGIRASSAAFGTLLDKIMARLSGAFIRKLIKASGYQDMAAPVTVAKRGTEAGDNQIGFETFETEVQQLVDGKGPWAEKDAFIDLRATLMEEAKAEEERVRASEQATENKLADISLGDAVDTVDDTADEAA